MAGSGRAATFVQHAGRMHGWPHRRGVTRPARALAVWATCPRPTGGRYPTPTNLHSPGRGHRRQEELAAISVGSGVGH